MMLSLPVQAQQLTRGTKIPIAGEIQLAVKIGIGGLKYGDSCTTTKYGGLEIIEAFDDTAIVRYTVKGHIAYGECPNGVLTSMATRALRDMMALDRANSEARFWHSSYYRN